MFRYHGVLAPANLGIVDPVSLLSVLQLGSIVVGLVVSGQYFGWNYALSDVNGPGILVALGGVSVLPGLLYPTAVGGGDAGADIDQRDLCLVDLVGILRVVFYRVKTG